MAPEQLRVVDGTRIDLVRSLSEAVVSLASGPKFTTYLRVIGHREYVKEPSPLWIGAGYSAHVARELAPRWAVAPVGTIKDICNSTLADFAAAITKLQGRSLMLLPCRTIFGVSVVGVQATDGTVNLGTLWVTTSEPTRPVQLDVFGNRGELDFLNWDTGTPPTPPAGARPLPAKG
jgi:hypothetical protein